MGNYAKTMTRCKQKISSSFPWLFPCALAVLLLSSCAPDVEISPSCKSKLEQGRLRAGAFHVSKLEDCIYDFLAFMAEAQPHETRGSDGFKKTAASFRSKHLELFEAHVKKEIRDAAEDKSVFTDKRIAEDVDNAVRKEAAFLNDFIAENKDRRRYYVERLSLRMAIAGPYELKEKTLHVQASVACDAAADVFYDLCELSIQGWQFEYHFFATPADAERIMAKKEKKKTVDIHRRVFVAPVRQGVYKPSWLFRDKKYIATARLAPEPELVADIEKMIKMWVFGP